LVAREPRCRGDRTIARDLCRDLDQRIRHAGVVALAFAFAGFALPEAEQTPLLVAAVISGVVAIVFSIWLFVWLGFLKGTQGPNAYGPDSLGAQQTDAKLQA
jgi:uncharacterized membrane protein YhaH (DUF805 family)